MIRLPDILVPSDTIFINFLSSYSPTFSYVSLSSSYFITWQQISSSSVNFTFNRGLTTDQTLNIIIYNIITPPSVTNYSQFYIDI